MTLLLLDQLINVFTTTHINAYKVQRVPITTMNIVIKLRIENNGQRVNFLWRNKTRQLPELKQDLSTKYNMTNYRLWYENSHQKHIDIVEATDFEKAMQDAKNKDNKTLYIRVQNILNKERISFSTNEKCDAIYPLNCPSIRKLSATLDKFRTFDMINDAKHQDELIKYCNETYTTFIDDFNHLVEAHSQDLLNIHQVLTESGEYEFAKCQISSCKATFRHHLKKDKNNANNERDTTDRRAQLYQNILDELHFYLLHIYDVGMRVKNQENNVDESKLDEPKNDLDCYDKQFAHFKQVINDTNKVTQEFERFKSNRFNVGSGMTARTWMSYIIDRMRKHDTSGKITQQLCKFIQDEEYDSESVEFDVMNVDNGNIENTTRDKSCTECLEDFIRTCKVRASAFAVGIVFYYWEFYRNHDQKLNDIDNMNYHDGHHVDQLFVEKKYDSFKEELLNKISSKEYNDMIMKTAEYFMSNNAKKIKACDAKSMIHLHYGIKPGSKWQEKHLQAIILYTDNTVLCTKFSQSFRAIFSYESLESIKQRNREYWWMSKALREAIQIFGDDGYGDPYDDSINILTGPFYTGMSSERVVYSFNIRLCSPTSTSRQLSAAMKFAKGNGMVIEFNNDGDIAGKKGLKAFNVSWLSSYPEEDECLFFGGDYRIRLKSIRMMRPPHNNYETFQHALFWFDCMITASNMMKCTDGMTETDFTIMKELIKSELKQYRTMDIAKYVLDSFHLLCEQKKCIIIHLEYIDKYFEKMNGLIMESIVTDDKLDGSNKYSKRNICQTTTMQLFPNMEKLIIYTKTTETASKSYSLSLKNLIPLFEESQVDSLVVIVKGLWKESYYKEQSWIDEYWRNNAKNIEKLYQENQLCIKLSEDDNVTVLKEKEDCISISRIK
eukprot:200295_1